MGISCQKNQLNLKALCETFRENAITPEALKWNEVLIEKITEQAETVLDYHHSSYTRHLLGDIIMIVSFAVLGNANEWGEMAEKISGAALWGSYR